MEHPKVKKKNPDKSFSHTLGSLGWWPRPAYSFRSAQASTLLEFHVPPTNCFVRRWFCVVHGPKPPVHGQNWLRFATFQETECFLFPVHATFRHGCSLAVKPAGTSRRLVQRKIVERFSTCWYAPVCYVYLGCCAAEFGSSGGTYELPCIHVCVVSPLCQSQDSSGTVQWLYHFSAVMDCVKCQAAKWNWTNSMTAETDSLTPLI
jgi:hypothetical protein